MKNLRAISLLLSHFTQVRVNLPNLTRGAAFLCVASALGAPPAHAVIPLGPEFQVNSFTPNPQGRPAAAADGSGGFIVVWESVGSPALDPTSYSIQGQRYAAGGSALGSQFQVNSFTASHQNDPAVAADAAGNFVVVWTSNGSAGSDNSSTSIHGQRYAANGVALGSEFQVNTFTTSTQQRPVVACDAAGNFVVVWESNGSLGSDQSATSIQAQRYAAGGSALGSEFQVNTYTPSDSDLPSLRTWRGTGSWFGRATARWGRM